MDLKLLFPQFWCQDRYLGAGTRRPGLQHRRGLRESPRQPPHLHQDRLQPRRCGRRQAAQTRRPDPCCQWRITRGRHTPDCGQSPEEGSGSGHPDSGD